MLELFRHIIVYLIINMNDPNNASSKTTYFPTSLVEQFPAFDSHIGDYEDVIETFEALIQLFIISTRFTTTATHTYCVKTFHSYYCGVCNKNWSTSPELQTTIPIIQFLQKNDGVDSEIGISNILHAMHTGVPVSNLIVTPNIFHPCTDMMRMVRRTEIKMRHSRTLIFRFDRYNFLSSKNRSMRWYCA